MTKKAQVDQTILENASGCKVPRVLVCTTLFVRSAVKVAVKTQPVLQSTLTCPHCGHRATETMPTNACQFFYDCKGCGELLRPKAGDCCVFCSYGTVPCPPIQQQRPCCR
jgi:hypothetical protein